MKNDRAAEQSDGPGQENKPQGNGQQSPSGGGSLLAKQKKRLVRSPAQEEDARQDGQDGDPDQDPGGQ